MLNKLIIIGAGGHCRSVLSAAKLMQTWEDYKVIDFNSSKQNEQIMGCKVLPFNNALLMSPSLSTPLNEFFLSTTIHNLERE